jgi:hypothetical protein
LVVHRGLDSPVRLTETATPMPAGSFIVDTSKTFAVALMMSSGPKLKFGSAEQDVSATGERKWEVQCAVTFQSEYGMPPASDVIKITVLGGTDPAQGIAPGTPVTFESFKVGISAPEKTERGIRGGKPYYQAGAVKPASQFARQPEKAA